MTRIKICGITNIDDARAAVDAGADQLGFVFSPSPRKMLPADVRDIVSALPTHVTSVGVFRDADRSELERIAAGVGLDFIQLHGDESPKYCKGLNRHIIKRIAVREGDSASDLRARMQRYEVSAFVLDPGAGDGRIFDWRIASDLNDRVILAGGLTPANVAQAVRLVRPYGVDVASGTEQSPGHKDIDKLRQFVRAVREEDAQHDAR
jgi:phosphoribosylanthranilate isomerase